MYNNYYVSVIIPALNEAEVINDCLSSLVSMNYPKENYEIILVDNGSTDDTLKIAQKYDVQIFQKSKITISALRNLGVKFAKGNILAFVDADCVVSQDWLKTAMSYLVYDNRIGAVGSRYQLPQNAGWIEKVWYSHLKEMNYCGRIKWLQAGNLLLLKKRFIEIGGFNEALQTSEDVDFCNRLSNRGYIIFSDPLIKVSHLGNPKTLSQFFKRELWYSKDLLVSFIDNLPRMTNIRVTLFGFMFAILIVLLPIGIKRIILNNDFSLFIATLLFIIVIPSVLAFNRIIKSKAYNSFAQLIVLFLIYGVARGLSILNPFNWHHKKVSKI